MRNGHGWRGRVFGLALLVALAAILLPGWAHAQQQRNVTSRFDVRLGGYIQMNVTWDGDEASGAAGDSINNFRRFSVVKGSEQEGRETLRWSAFRTRLFMDIRGPDVWGAKSRGYVESDFDGFREEGSATHADTPRLRRAWMQFAWPVIEVRIGQDNQLLNGAVGSESEVSGTTSGSRGEITGGARNRVPQIRVKSDIPIGPVTLEVAGSVAHNSTDRGVLEDDDDQTDSGARADFPALSGRAMATMKVFGRDLILAISGYYAEEKFVNAAKAEADVQNTGIALEALIPIGPVFPFGAFDIRGNYFTGENMARWNLGNNAGVTTTDPTRNPDEIQSDGWWVEGNWVLPFPGFALGGGYGRMEDDRGDLIRTGGTRIEENEGWWAFAKYTTGPFLFTVQGGIVTTTRLNTATLVATETDSGQIHFIFRYRF